MRTEVDVPKHGVTILTTRGAEGTIRGNSNGVDVTGVTGQSELGDVLDVVVNLDELVPASGNESIVAVRGGEADGRNPVVVTLLLLEGDDAVTEGVPDLDRAITGTGEDLAVVRGEGNGKNILGVTGETELRSTSLKVPKTKGTIPRTRDSVLAISGEGNVLNEVVVAHKALLRKASSSIPEDKRLITGSRDDEVRGSASGDSSDPAVVALELRTKNERFRHTVICTKIMKTVQDTKYIL